MSKTDLSKRNLLSNSLLAGGILGVAVLSSKAQAQTGSSINIVNSFAALGSTAASVGDIVEIRGHTLAGVGGGDFIAISGSVTNDYGTKINSATSGIYWQRTNYVALTVEMFGAVGNGITNDSLAIQNAITAAETANYASVNLSNKNYKINDMLVITKPIALIGARQDGLAFPGGVAAISGTKLTWGGGLAAMLFAGNVNYGLKIENITFDGSTSAAYCLHLDSSVGASISDCWFKNASIHSCLLDARTGTCSWNTLTRCRFTAGYGGAATSALCLAGYEGGYNACHDTIISSNIEYARQAHGILLGFCDNCTFIDTYMNRGSDAGITPTGKGVTYSASGSSWAYGNTFVHLQAGTGGYHEPAMPYSPYATAQIFGYALDNAEPPPVFNGNTGTCVVTNGNEIFGFRKLGIGTTSVPSVPSEITAGARGTHSKFGNNGYIGSYDDQNFYMSDMTVTGAGSFIAKSTAVAGIGFNGSKVTIFGQDGLTNGAVINGGGLPNALLTLDKNLLGFYGSAGISKQTGFGTPTGASRLSNFPGATATLAQTSAALADLLTILKNRGDIGN